MSTNEKKTVGAASIEGMLKHPEAQSPMELAEAMLKDYEDHLVQCVESGLKQFPQSNFYVVVIGKRERLMQNVLRNFFVARQSCPTPQFEQTVYRYDYKEEALEELWVIPDMETCNTYIMNALMVDPSERQLLEYVLRLKDGELDLLCQQLNGELN